MPNDEREVGVGDDGDGRQTRKNENWDYDCGLGDISSARVGIGSLIWANRREGMEIVR